MLTWDKSEATTHSAACVGGHKNANEERNELQDAAQPRLRIGSPLPGHKQIIRRCFGPNYSCLPYDFGMIWFDFDFRLINVMAARDF